MLLSEFVIAEPVDFQDLKQAPENGSQEQPLLLTSLKKEKEKNKYNLVLETFTAKLRRL